MLVHFSGKPFIFDSQERGRVLRGAADVHHGERVAENWMLGAL